jgi:hypothetical protein
VDSSIIELLTSDWITSSYARLCLAGDFNFPDIDWITFSWPAARDDFMNAVFDCDLYQHVRAATRKRNCLDLVFTHRQDEVANVEILPPLTPSCDHNIVAFELTWNMRYSSASAVMRYPVYSASDLQWTQFESFVQCSGLEESVINSESVDVAWCSITNCIFEGLDRFIPMRQVKRKDREKPIWASFEAWRAIKRKRNAYRRFRRCNTRAAWEMFTGYAEECDRLCQMSRRSFELKLAANIKTDVKSFHAYCNRRHQPSVGCTVLKRPDGSLCDDPKECAAIFNDFFASVFTQPGAAHPFYVQPEKVPPIASSIEFTCEEVRKKLSTLDVKKASGPDCIPNLVFYRLATVLAAPLCLLFQRSYHEGSLPSEWLTANVVPLHKKGPTDTASNYRPISLTSKPCKVMEQFVVEHMCAHVDRHELLHASQYGFSKGKSCASQLLRYVDYLSDAVNNGDLADAVYFDFQKAFDSVPHDRLLQKLRQFGFHPLTEAWVSAFLSGRSQCVVFRGSSSPQVPVMSGVPQGSVMGPFLFLLYVNDMDDVVSSRLLKFADDLKLFRRLSSCNPLQDVMLLQKDIDALSEWSVANALHFNPSKCVTMHFGRNNPSFDYSLSSNTLVTCTHMKDLGVTISCDLKWSEHCRLVATRANQVLGMVRRNIKHFTRSSLIHIIKSLIRPHLEYSVQVWSPYYRKDIEMIERVHRRATKLLPSIRHLSYEERLEFLQLQSLETRRLRADLILVYQIVHGKVKGLDGLFEAGNPETRGHLFKLKTKIAPKLACRQNYFSNRVVNMWNRLPPEVAHAPSVDAFKALLHVSGAISRV